MKSPRPSESLFGALQILGLVFSGMILGAVPALAGIRLSLTSPDPIVALGDTIIVEAMISQAGSSFNAFDLQIRFDPTRLAFIPTTPTNNQRGPLMTSACGTTFHQFSAGASSLDATLSLLCSSISVTGPGTIYRVRFRSLGSLGETGLFCGPGTAFFDAGVLNPDVQCDSLRVYVGFPAAVEPRPDETGGLRLSPVWPNPIRAGSTLRGIVESSSSGRAELTLVDARGRVVARGPALDLRSGPAAFEFPLSGLSSSLYLLLLQTSDGETRARRVVVVH